MYLKERNQQIAKLRQEGRTYSEIAKIFGISLERVAQICRHEEREERLRQNYPEMIKLSKRARKAALRMGIHNRREMKDWLEKHKNLGLMKLPDVGAKTAAEMEKWMEDAKDD